MSLSQLLLSFFLPSSLTACNYIFFFFNDTATTEIYTLSLHDALPIFGSQLRVVLDHNQKPCECARLLIRRRSEEHTSELQSQSNLVCRLLLEKKKTLIGRTFWT